MALQHQVQAGLNFASAALTKHYASVSSLLAHCHPVLFKPHGAIVCTEPSTRSSYLSAIVSPITYALAAPFTFRCWCTDQPNPVLRAATGQVILDTAKGSGVHTIPFQPVSGYQVLDALITASSALKVDISSGVSVAFDANNASVGDSASITICEPQSYATAAGFVLPFQWHAMLPDW